MERALGLGPRLLGVFVDIVADAVDERVDQAFRDRLFAPGEIDLAFLRALTLETLGRFEQPVGRVRRGG